MGSNGNGGEREMVEIPVELLVDDGEVREGDGTVPMAELEASIAREGILTPILIDNRRDCNIVTGRRRFRVAVARGLAKVPCVVLGMSLTPEQADDLAVQANIQVPASDADKLRVLERRRPAVEAAARQRQDAARRKPRGKGEGGAKPAPPKPKRTVNKELGDQVGWSAEKVRQAAVVADAAKRAPSVHGETYRQMMAGSLSVHAAWKRVEEVEAQLKEADAACEHPAEGDETTNTASEPATVAIPGDEAGITSSSNAGSEASSGELRWGVIEARAEGMLEDAQELAARIRLEVGRTAFTDAELRRIREPLAAIVAELDQIIGE